MKIVLMIIACVVIVLTTMQAGKSDAVSSFTGSKNLALFSNTKERGTEKTLMQITYIAVSLFLIVSLIVSLN